jgi:hypothetical protein
MQDMPNHLFSRLQQIAVAKFALETDAHKFTHVQWASLHATREKPIATSAYIAPVTIPFNI